MILKDILSQINYIKFIGQDATVITELKVLEVSNLRDDVLLWCNDKNISKLLEISHGTIVCSSKVLEITLNSNCNYVIVDSPKLVYTRIIELFMEAPQFLGIHPTAIIDSQAEIHPSVSIGAYCVIGKSKIGENTRIDASCIVHDKVQIGKNVWIREHCSIGGGGFGFIRNENGKLEKMHHIGGVVIEDEVELFPFVNVDRATLSETRIRKGTKVDHYAHIGHNCTIGEDCIITAKVVFCGGSSVGSSTWIGVGTIIKEKVKVGNKVLIGLGSIVTKDIPDGETWMGAPAKRDTDYKMILKAMGKLIE